MASILVCLCLQAQLSKSRSEAAHLKELLKDAEGRIAERDAAVGVLVATAEITAATFTATANSTAASTFAAATAAGIAVAAAAGIAVAAATAAVSLAMRSYSAEYISFSLP
jgi:hypothetical protein